jgi:hypothetical protein
MNQTRTLRARRTTTNARKERIVMFRRIAMVGIAAVLAGLAVGGAALATSAPAGTQPSASEQGQTFKLLEHETSFVNGTKGKTGPGSLFMIHSVLRTSDGKPAGVKDFMCTDLSKGAKGVFHCNGTDTFSDGSTIEWAGLGKTSSLDFSVSITGGTGRYTGAEGEVAYHSLNSSGTKDADTYKLDG